MSKKNNEDFVIDEDSLAGPAIQKTDLYKNMEKEICFHAKVKDNYPNLRTNKKVKDRGIKINFYRNKKRGANNDYYAVKYYFIWREMLIDTCFPVTDSLNLEPFEFITKQLKQFCEIFKNSYNIKEIKKVKYIKRSIIKKADAELQRRIKSIVAE